MIIDHREQRFGLYAEGMYPERPLLGMRLEDGGFSPPMPQPLSDWKEALDFRLELAIEQHLTEAQNELEGAMLEAKPDLEAFIDSFRVVRWRQDPPRDL